MPWSVAWTHGDHQVAWLAAWAQWNHWEASALHSTRRHNHQMASTYPRHLVVWLAGWAPGHWGEGRATARALKGYRKALVAAYTRIRGDRTAIARATERDGDGAFLFFRRGENSVLVSPFWRFVAGPVGKN